MFGRRSEQIPSGQIGDEVLAIYDSRQQSIDRSDETIESLTDTPAKTAAEFKQSYYETFYDTPAKQMLWQAEQYIPKVEAITEEYFPIRDIDDATLKIDLIEALSTVMPDEAWRVLQTMPDSDEKVEALAKFGKNTDPIFIHQARDLAFRIDTEAYRRLVIYNLLKVADLAMDDQSLQLAYQEAVAETLDESARKVLDPWDTTDNYVKVASLGHGPALIKAKRGVLHKLRSSEPSHGWMEQMALVSYIDELTKKGDIPTRFAVEVEQMPEYESIETAWADKMMEYRSAVAEILKNGVELPRFDSLSGDLFYVGREAKKCSTLNGEVGVIDYINNTAAGYADILMTQGLDKLEEIKQIADIAKPTMPISRRDLTRHIKNFQAQWALRPGAIQAVYGRRSVGEEIKIYDSQNVWMFRALNRVAIFRGLCLAGVGLHDSIGA